jgi:hypothetical protein
MLKNVKEVVKKMVAEMNMNLPVRKYGETYFDWYCRAYNLTPHEAGRIIILATDDATRQYRLDDPFIERASRIFNSMIAACRVVDPTHPDLYEFNFKDDPDFFLEEDDDFYKFCFIATYNSELTRTDVAQEVFNWFNTLCDRNNLDVLEMQARILTADF